MTQHPLEVVTPDPVAEAGALGASADVAGKSLSQLAWARVRRDRLGMISLVLIIVIAVITVFAPLIVHLFNLEPVLDASSLNDATGGLPYGWQNSGISVNHPLGVEPGTGRDIAGLLLYGARISLLIASSSTIFVVLIGTVIGTIAGYMGGMVDTVLGRFMDLILSFPLLLMVLALTPVVTARLTATFHVPAGNPSRILYLILVFSLFGWPYLARIVRGQVISLREREFVESAVAMGASSRRIIFKELIPNLWAPVLIYATITLPTFIAFEAALSFLGVGVAPPDTTWGKMLSDSLKYYTVVPTYLFIPGTLLFVVVLSFNLLGDAVRDALDPRQGRV